MDIHHRLHNTKPNRKLFPLFIQSPMNGVGTCRDDHDSGAIEVFKITEKEARMYEEWLEEKIREGQIWD